MRAISLRATSRQAVSVAWMDSELDLPIGIYVRSTRAWHEAAHQYAAYRTLALRMGVEEMVYYEDSVDKERPKLRELLKDAQARKFQAIAVANFKVLADTPEEGREIVQALFDLPVWVVIGALVLDMRNPQDRLRLNKFLS